MDEHVITVTPDGPHYFRVTCSCEHLSMNVPASGWQELGITIQVHLANQKTD